MTLSTWTARANTVFSYFGVVMAVLIGAHVASTYFLHPTVEPVLRFHHLIKLEQLDQAQKADQALFTFDLKVDLRDAFHWGTKQVFCYITAHYRTSQFADNQVVVWDHIFTAKEDANITLVNKKIKYPLRDNGHGLTKNEIKLVFSYQVHPIAGLLIDRHFDDAKHAAVFTTGEYTN